MFVPLPPESIESSKTGPQAAFDTSFGRCPQAVRSIDCAPLPARGTWGDTIEDAAAPQVAPGLFPTIEVGPRIDAPLAPQTTRVSAVPTTAGETSWQRTDSGHPAEVPAANFSQAAARQPTARSAMAPGVGRPATPTTGMSPPESARQQFPQTPFAQWYDAASALPSSELVSSDSPPPCGSASPSNPMVLSAGNESATPLNLVPQINCVHPPALGSAPKSPACTWRWPRVVDELVATQWPLVNRLGHTALSASRDEVQRILVTGPQRGVGKTTIALTLARWAAMTRERVLLIEADFRNPKLAFRLGLTPPNDWRRSNGWRQAIQSLSASRLDQALSTNETASDDARGSYDEHLVHCDALPLSILPLATLPLREMPARNMMEQLILLISLAEQEFDCCVIDAGPIPELITQIDSITRLATSIVVVNSMQAVGQADLTLACNELWRRGCPSLTIAENKSTSIRA